MDGTAITQLKSQLQKLQEEREELSNDLQEERVVVTQMQQELASLKQKQQIQGGQLRDKELAIQDFNRMIKESETILKKLIETSNNFLKTLEGETNKLKNQKK
ncbi:unnamed protein product (macronuclear) [Paramecium tetraurelia]|uniref:Uncharacterized protein n=1 Tax=Paramecium tetraurelia TaxID=5888 RepID=A0DB31_PARTE|nr:uncharacterized protein GSPATT00015142001 [Paramecium tetraurelia]CAK80248.1 unnamed protein product [Paramecium tetraurelia]|eukprot:XP_001447645.1 hypothetical protein (macronuclear) [Paramecium tetraurelia strain d4-2]